MTALAPARDPGRAGPGPTGPAGPGPTGPAGPGPTGPAGRAPAGPPRRAALNGPISPRQLAAGFVTLFLEVEAGLRPRRHITAVMCPLLVARMDGTWVHRGPPGTLVRLVGSRPADGVYEASAVVRRGQRYGAVGLRLARRGGTWRVEDLARPEVGPLPPAPFPVCLDGPSDQEEHAGARRSPEGAGTD